MRLTEQTGSLFFSLSEPDETYREGCFSYQKWFFDTPSSDEKWIILRREFLTLSEQAMEWIDRFEFPESTKLDTKRLIWDIKYEDFKRVGFSSPIVIALCALKVACDLKSINFFSNFDGCVNVIRNNMKGRKIILQHNIASDASAKEKIRAKSRQMLELIGTERIERIKKMWGCMDEARLLA